MPRASRLIGLISLLALALSSPPAHAEGVDPSLALWGSSAIALLFTLGGSLALAWYHRAQGALDGRITELRERAQRSEERLQATREEYARKTDIERLNTLEATLRQDFGREIEARTVQLRGELRDDLSRLEHRINERVTAMERKVDAMDGKISQVLAIITRTAGGV